MLPWRRKRLLRSTEPLNTYTIVDFPILSRFFDKPFSIDLVDDQPSKFSLARFCKMCGKQKWTICRQFVFFTTGRRIVSMLERCYVTFFGIHLFDRICQSNRGIDLVLQAIWRIQSRVNHKSDYAQTTRTFRLVIRVVAFHKKKKKQKIWY